MRGGMASEARGFPLVLWLLIALDTVTAFYGYAVARDVFIGAAPMAAWPAIAWWFAAAVIACPVLAITGIAVSLLWRRGPKGARIACAAAPLLYSLIWEMIVQAAAMPAQSL